MINCSLPMVLMMRPGAWGRGGGSGADQPLVRVTARRQRPYAASSRWPGSNRRSSPQVAASSSVEDQVPVASPARNAAPSAVVSPTTGYSTQIAVSLWFVTRNKRARITKDGVRQGDRSTRTLFIDARHCGSMVDRTHRDLKSDDIEAIVSAYRSWRAQDGTYRDVPGFCREATIDEIKAHRYVLVPGRYVGFAGRPSLAPLDRGQLRSDLDEIAEQIHLVESLSRSAVQTLREVLRG